MKKILAFFLSFLLFVPMISSFAKSEEPFTAEAYSHILQLGLTDQETEPTFIVTRKEFARLIEKLMKIETPQDNGVILSFSDVSANDPDYGSIVFCVSMGYMKGYDDGTFRPSQPISGLEATKVFVSMLNYDLAASYQGGYPYGYLEIAKEISLIKGVSVSDEYMTKGELIQLTYQLLLAYPNVLTSITDRMETYKKSDRIFAEHYLKLKRIEGIAQGDYITRLTDHGSLEKDQILIGDSVYQLSDAYQKNLVGKQISCFYDENSKQIASIAELGNKNKELVIRSKDFSSFHNNALYYETEDKVLKAQIPEEIKYIYNNQFVMYYDLNLLSEINSGEIRLLDNNNDNRFDIAFIINYDTYLADIIYSGQVIGDGFPGGKLLDLKEDGEKETLIRDLDGKEISFSQIQTGNILSVIENDEMRIVTVNDLEVSGTIESVSTSEKGGRVVLNGKEHTLAPGVGTGISPGTFATLYFNCYKECAFIQVNGSTVYLSGYIVAGEVPQSTFETLKIKFYMPDGTFQIYSLSDKYRVNNETYTGSVFAPDLYGNVAGKLKRRPIQFKLDAQQKIKEIILPKDKLDKGEDGFFKTAALTGITYQPNVKSFGGITYINEKTSIMQVPSDENETAEEKFCIVPVSKLPNISYTLEAYQYSVESPCTDLLVIKGNTFQITFDSGTAVFTELTKAVGPKGDVISVLKYVSDGVEGKIYVDGAKFPKALEMSKGDVFRFANDVNNEMTSYLMVYDMSENAWKMNNNPTTSNFFDSFRMSFGYVADLSGGFLRLSYQKEYPTDSSVYTLEGHGIKNYKITVVQTSAQRVVVKGGSASDINIGDKVIAITRSGSGRALIIFKES